MTTWQKTVKYIAIGIAIFLTVCIIGGILGVIRILGGFAEDDALKEAREYSVSQDITALKVDIVAADFMIKVSDEFSVESNLSYLNLVERDGILTITEKERYIFGVNHTGATLVLYVPEGTTFDSADISTGAGRVTIDALSADRLSLELGAGEVVIGELNGNSQAKIEGGAGALTIKDGVLYNLDLDMGVGHLNLTAAILGNSDLNYGVGEANLNLLGTKEDYCLEFEKGIGNAVVDGKSIKDDEIYGDGANEIDVEGGVGSVTVTFQQRKMC